MKRTASRPPLEDDDDEVPVRGRPPLADDDTSVPVHVKIPSRAYQEVYTRAQREHISVPERIRRDMRVAALVTGIKKPKIDK